MDKVLIRTIFYIILVCIIYYVYITYDDKNNKKNNGQYTKLNNDNKQNNDSKNNNNKLNNKYNMEMIIIIEGLNNNLNNLDKILKNRNKEDFSGNFVDSTDASLPITLVNIIDEWNSYFNHNNESPKSNYNIITENIQKIKNISENNKNINMNNILQNNKHLQNMIQNMNYNLVDNVGKLLHKVDKVNLHRQANMRADNEFPLRE